MGEGKLTSSVIPQSLSSVILEARCIVLGAPPQGSPPKNLEASIKGGRGHRALGDGPVGGSILSSKIHILDP